MLNKVFISTTTFGEDDREPLALLELAGWLPVLNPFKRRLNEAEIVQVLSTGEYQALLAGLEPLNRSVLSRAHGLKVISRVGVGLDNVDLAAAEEFGIRVFNTPGVLTDAVAELALGLMLSALRKIVLMDRKMRGGQWEKSMGALLKGKKVGVVGFGAIGQRVATLVSAFGASVLIADVRTVSLPGATQISFERLVAESDIVSLHASGKECLIGADEIRAMKPGVILVNTARGTLIDERALADGLLSGKIACAALDVFCNEPYQGELLALENTILTAHVGSYAREARVVMELTAVENIIKGQ